MRLLVVDDEHIVIESVSNILKQNFESIDFETAYNSREALIRFEKFRPNIVMTDIKMPGMNGIELIERIRKIDNGVKIIIVSAHDHFDFAKDAVRFGVEDYILKPMTKQKLIQTLTAVMNKVLDEEASRDKELSNIEKYYQSIQLVESNFFNSILLGRNYMKFVPHYQSVLEINMSVGQFVVIDFTNYSSKSAPGELSVFNQKVNLCSDYLRTEIKSRHEAIVSHPFLNRIFIYIECRGIVVEQYLRDIIQQVMERYQLKIRIGVGGIKDIEQIAESYAEALLAIKLTEESVVYFSNLDNVHASIESFLDAKRELYNAFVSKSRQFNEKLKKFEGEYMKMQAHEIKMTYAEAVLLELLVEIAHLFENRNYQKKHYLSDFLNKSATLKIHFFERLVKEWFMIYVKLNHRNYNDITYDALKYIQTHYAEELTLEALSSVVSVTPQYLSKLFKDDTGLTFKEYLTETRIEASKVLLKEGQLSIKDIGFKVGYNDTNYFIRSFKKYEGITPKDYQRMNL